MLSWCMTDHLVPSVIAPPNFNFKNSCISVYIAIVAVWAPALARVAVCSPALLHLWRAMSTIPELTKELTDMSAFLAARAALHTSDASKRVATNMVASFCKKVLSIKLFDAHSALALCNAVTNSSLPAEHSASIQQAIDARMDGTSANEAPWKSSSQPQKLTSQITEYLTASDWEKLRCEKVARPGNR